MSKAAWWFSHRHLHHRTYAVVHLLAMCLAIFFHGVAIVHHVFEDRKQIK